MPFGRLIHPEPAWLDAPTPRRVLGAALAGCAGFACYGFTLGVWRDPLMGFYVAIKLPLLVALILLANGLLNGLLGQLLGSGLGFRQSFLALLTSFAVAALILGSLAPVTFFMAWNAPATDSVNAASAHSAYIAVHTTLIAIAGIAANLHLHRLLTGKAPTRLAATLTLLAWLGGNGFIGAQFSWILRPFFGSPFMAVQFLRPQPLKGNFYQTVWNSFENLTHGFAPLVLVLVLSVATIPILKTIRANLHKPPP